MVCSTLKTAQILVAASVTSNVNPDVSQILEIAQNFLQSYGRLFAFIRVPNTSKSSSLRAIAEFCDTSHATNVITKCARVTTPEVMLPTFLGAIFYISLLTKTREYIWSFRHMKLVVKPAYHPSQLRVPMQSTGSIIRRVTSVLLLDLLYQQMDDWANHSRCIP
jgi:hypothetical protein